MIAYSFEDPTRSLEFLNRVLESRGRLGEEACLCLDADTVVMKLQLGDVDGARNLLDVVAENLKSSNSNEAVVYSKYYKACAEFRKVSTMRNVCDAFTDMSLLLHTDSKPAPPKNSTRPLLCTYRTHPSTVCPLNSNSAFRRT